MHRSTNRSTVAAPMSAHPVTVRNIAKSVGAYVRGEQRRGSPRLDTRVECDAPNAPNRRRRQRSGEWYIPLATLNLKDYEDFNQHHGLRILGRE
jgi:hypothetical protein